MLHKSKERLILKRSSILKNEDVGKEFFVHNGLSLGSFVVTGSMVGHFCGEFFFPKRLGGVIHQKKKKKVVKKKHK